MTFVIERLVTPRLGDFRDRELRRASDQDWRALVYLSRGERKYGEEFWIAEKMKLAMRARYRRAVADTTGESRERFMARSREFWAEYENVNRIWLPQDPVYSGSREGVALATTTDFWTLTSPGSGQLRVLETYIAGEATASAVARVAINRPSGAGATATNQTPEKFSTRSPAAVATFATTWTTQPTLSSTDPVVQAFNAFGGQDRWVPQPGAELYQVNGEQLSCRSRSGTSTCSGHVMWEEL